MIPRNIQELLDEPSWKLVVFEEKNALKKWNLGGYRFTEGKKGCRVQMGVYNKE